MRGVRVGVKPNTPAWLAWRARGITATDTAAILGLSPWASPFDLWWRKRGDREALADGQTLTDEFDRSQRYEVGHALEPVLTRFFEAEALPDGWRVGSGGCWQGRGALSWLRATPDRMIYPDRRTRTPVGLLEIKTSATYASFGEDDGSGLPDVPVAYRAQMIHQMIVCGVSEATLTVLTPSMAVRHYRIRATDEEMALVLEAAEAFEKSLRRDTPPDVDGHEATTARIKDLWHDQSGQTVEVDERLAWELWQANDEYKQAKAALDYTRNRILAEIGDGRAAITADGTKVASRSVTRRKATDHAAVKTALASLAGTFPFDPRALTVEAPAPTVSLRITAPKTSKPKPITEEK